MTELREVVTRIFESSGIPELAAGAADDALLARLSGSADGRDDLDTLAEAGAILETRGVRAYRESTASLGDGNRREEAQRYFAASSSCVRLLAELRRQQFDARTVDDEILPGGLDLPFRVAVASLVARQTADVRLELRSLVRRDDHVAAVATGAVVDNLNWDERLLCDTFGSFVLLVRKADGWDDVDSAIAALNRLRAVQEREQTDYLRGATERDEVNWAVARLVALFHLAQCVTIVGDFLRRGDGSSPALMSRIDRHRDQAHDALNAAGTFGDDLRSLADLLWIGCRELMRNSIWAHIDGLGSQVRELAHHLTSSTRERPVLELWPSQQEALAGNILDQYRRAVLVQMPTSAGKSLLAEFLIVQSRALMPEATAAYVVPTRALVNQVTRDLRADLGPLNFSVEQAVSAYELDPAEQVMLADAPDVLVATPEKLSLLIRRSDPSVANVGLVIVDEAHSIGDGARGARLELLLATIRRDRPGARYLLLSPFLPNAQQLVEWLGDDRGLPPVSVRWRPGRRIVAAGKVEGRRPQRRLVLETLDAASGADLGPGHEIDLGNVTNKDMTGSKTIKDTTRLLARALRPRGTTLILCAGKATAMNRASELAADARELPADAFRSAVANYLSAEIGADSALSRFVRAGFAYHHSGMSQEARSLVECLVRRELVHTVCGTTTLAQGVNFPITSVVIETSRKGRDDSLSYADLWNVIGRAGRALVDDAGLVAFPVTNATQEQRWQEYMRGEAREIASQLSTLVDRADLLMTFGLREIRNQPELGDMLQFLAHAMHVGGATQTAAELEDLLRSSLVYRQASQEPGRSESLVRLCRRYLQQISGQPGYAALSDQTGFSTPTVGMLLAQRSADPGLADAESWQPDTLFGRSIADLTARMRVLGEVPELGLGWEGGGTFNPERVARIVSGWVNGEPLVRLARTYGEGGSGDDLGEDKLVADFSTYLYSTVAFKASWGLGALESAYLPAPDEPDPNDSTRYVPSMVYFGVHTPQAVWMRMAGLPRLAAVQAGRLWQDRVGDPPRTHADLRDWLGQLSTRDWGLVVRGHAIGGSDMKRIWDEALA